MNKHAYLLFLFVFVLLSLSACKDEEEPVPKPESYIEFAGRVYELRTALFISQSPPNERKIIIEFYSMEKEELDNILIPEKGQFLEGQIISLGLSSPVDGMIGEGQYTFQIHNSSEFFVYNADIIIGYDTMKEAGIFLHPVAGTVNFVKQDGGYLVSFDFVLSNEDRVVGRYQGNLVKTN